MFIRTARYLFSIVEEMSRWHKGRGSQAPPSLDSEIRDFGESREIGVAAENRASQLAQGSLIAPPPPLPRCGGETGNSNV